MVNCCLEGVSNIKRRLKKAPQADTLLMYLKSQEREDLKKAFDSIVERNVELLRKKGLFRGPVAIAIDWQDVRYYGSKNAEMVVLAKHEKGTSYAYRYLTVSVLKGLGRLTIVVLPISSRKLIKELLELVFKRIEKLGIKVWYVVLDSGFYSNEIIDFLSSINKPYCLRRGSSKAFRKLKHGSILKGSTKKGTEYKIVASYHKKKRKKYFFVTNTNKNADELLEEYDSRWGIETSYRMHNQFMIKTTSKNYTLRLFFFLFAVAMYNCWVCFRLIVGRYITIVELKIAFIIISTLGEDSLIESYVHT